MNRSPGPQSSTEPSIASLVGSWTASFADSLNAGIVEFQLEERSETMVVGPYAASTGGGGTISGTLSGNAFSFTLTQNVPKCPGTFGGTAILSGDHALGTYEGRDCLGEHKSGVVTFSRATRSISGPTDLKRDVDGNVIPLQYIHVQGEAFEAANSGKALVFASGIETVEYFAVSIAIQNNSTDTMTFEPRRVTVQDLISNSTLRSVSTQEVANRITRRASYRAMLAAFFAAYCASRPSVTVAPTYSTSGPAIVVDPYGNFTAGVIVGGTVPTTTTAYTYPNPTEVQNAVRSATEPIYSRAAQASAEVAATAAYTNTLFPNTYLAGYLYFSKPKKGDLRNLTGTSTKQYFVRTIVPVGNERFSFVFPFEVLRAADRLSKSQH